MEEIKVIDSKTASTFLLPRHYSGTKPQIVIAFGLYIDNRLMAVCTFGKPASPSTCDAICGKENSKYVYELNRLCREDDLVDYPLSKFVGYCLRYLKKNDWIIVSYSDTSMNHHGYIYMATNFIYTGLTDERLDKTNWGNHARHLDKERDDVVLKKRTAKHRYIYFCTNNQKLKKEWHKKLKWDSLPYPKGENKNYVLGDYIDYKIYDKDGNQSYIKQESQKKNRLNFGVK